MTRSFEILAFVLRQVDNYNGSSERRSKTPLSHHATFEARIMSYAKLRQRLASEAARLMFDNQISFQKATQQAVAARRRRILLAEGRADATRDSFRNRQARLGPQQLRRSAPHARRRFDRSLHGVRGRCCRRSSIRRATVAAAAAKICFRTASARSTWRERCCLTMRNS